MKDTHFTQPFSIYGLVGYGCNQTFNNFCSNFESIALMPLTQFHFSNRFEPLLLSLVLYQSQSPLNYPHLMHNNTALYNTQKNVVYLYYK